MSPMPPPGGMGGAFFFGISATIASVVMRRPAADAASCSAVRTTLAGSMTPCFTRLPYSPRGVVAEGVVVLVHDLADDHGAVFAGILGVMNLLLGKLWEICAVGFLVMLPRRAI